MQGLVHRKEIEKERQRQRGREKERNKTERERLGRRDSSVLREREGDSGREGIRWGRRKSLYGW